MELLEQRILSDGRLLPGGILKVDSFLNHQMDPQLLQAMAREIKRLFADVRVDESWAPRRPRTYNNKGVVNEYRQPKMAYRTVRSLFRR